MRQTMFLCPVPFPHWDQLCPAGELAAVHIRLGGIKVKLSQAGCKDKRKEDALKASPLHSLSRNTRRIPYLARI